MMKKLLILLTLILRLPALAQPSLVQVLIKTLTWKK